MRGRLLSSVAVIVISFALAPAAARGQEQLEKQLNQALNTSIGGYGVVRYQGNLTTGDGAATLERFVLFAGHRFSRHLSLVSEVEFEDAKVAGGETGGEVAVEQAFLQYDLSAGSSLVAGLFIPRLGILNEHHLPTEYNGNERPDVESAITPATWRELGLGVFGSIGSLPVDYSAAILTGLNAASFSREKGIREGRTEGFSESANSLAITGSLRWNIHPVTLQASGYYGGTLSIPAAMRDTLGLPRGAFGAPLLLGEIDMRFAFGPWEAKALVCGTDMRDAQLLSSAFGSEIPARTFGVLGEAGYDVASFFSPAGGARCILFARYERLDVNAGMPDGFARAAETLREHAIAGLTYFPDPGVVVKADVRSTRYPRAGRSETVLNLGIGFAF
jgi:hypothetical protein